LQNQILSNFVITATDMYVTREAIKVIQSSHIYDLL